jgi:hypothetical protein
VDFENSATGASSEAIWQGATNAGAFTADNNTIAGASTGTTWIHGRAVVQSTEGDTWIIISPVVGTLAIPEAGTASTFFVARITFLRLP